MKKIKFQSEMLHFNNKEELSERDQLLVESAFEHAKVAHAPYSNFKVGCAILLENGNVVGGSNQENASYPAGICAERTALSACASIFPNVKPIAMAIVVNDEEYNPTQPCAPCGICRQSISEAESRYGKIEIIFPAENKSFYKIGSIESILPFMFSSDSL